MANGIDDNEQQVRSATPYIGTGGNRQRMIDRQYANQIRDIAQDRGLMGTRRRAAVALAAAERNAPRNPASVNRPVVNESIRLLQEAVNNPRLTGGGRRALITGAAELGGRSDIAEDLTFGRGLRSVRLRQSPTSRALADDFSADDFSAVTQAGQELRAIQDRGLRANRGRRAPLLSDQNQINFFESSVGRDFVDDFSDLEPYTPEQF